MMHHLTAATVWQGEPIVLCILLPKGRQVKEYVAVRSSCQYGAQRHVQGRAVGTQPLPSMPSLEKGLSEAQASMLQVEITRDVQDLDDNQLWEILEALKTEMA